ncbi:MAG: hypothetical protein QNJ46_21180 [Leptolyngbyaceae cyanobacterium MO_188.B28]|nr:hypothetical protein [Leptolyngbyaceae cyanobacterium MO_188.B28]
MQTSKVIDWKHPAMVDLAQKIASNHGMPEEISNACFGWILDQIHHSYDY